MIIYYIKTYLLMCILQDINNPSYSVMILMAIYANMALKKAPASHEDQVMITIYVYYLANFLYLDFKFSFNLAA